MGVCSNLRGNEVLNSGTLILIHIPNQMLSEWLILGALNQAYPETHGVGLQLPAIVDFQTVGHDTLQLLKRP